MCSVFERGLYPFCGEDERRPNMVNVALPTRTASEALRAAVLEHWLPALDRFEPQLIFVSAGFDAHRDDDMGNLGWVDRDYEWLTQQLLVVARRHCGGKLISTLEGGYEPNALARSVAAHVRVLVGAD
jgi:acetoin utilization deacetylase AcuC-like enzyme